MIGQQLRLPYGFESSLASSSLVDIDTEVSRQIQAEFTVTTDVMQAREDAAAKERIGEAKFAVGDYVFMYTEVPIPGVTQKLQIPYRGQYRIAKLWRN